MRFASAFPLPQARNEEKSQYVPSSSPNVFHSHYADILVYLLVCLRSMLFRFREAQAVELGISKGRNDRRPRLASSCDNLKDCERWRGEILREISRKVSKIQDSAYGLFSSLSRAGLNDVAFREMRFGELTRLA